MARRTLEQRFWRRVTKTETCWVWSGSNVPTGYGRTSLGGRDIYAHRVAYELFVGPIADGLEIDHLCRNPSCVNPEHLEPVTQAENLRRAAEARSREPRLVRCRRRHQYMRVPGEDSSCNTCAAALERGERPRMVRISS